MHGPQRCRLPLLLYLLMPGFVGWQNGPAHAFEFEMQELPTRLGVGYAVRLVDMNADARLDIAIVDKRRVLWLDNPNWNEHTLIADQADTDNVCFAPYDIDGDGRMDFALGADWTLNTAQGGTIQWITAGDDPTEKWQLHPIGQEPTVHRMHFVDLDNDGKDELVVLPLMGRNTTRPEFAESAVRLLAFHIPADPVSERWTPEVINDELHVTHNFWPVDMDADGQIELLVASFEGVSLLERGSNGTWKRTLIGRGNQKTSPNRGSSEVKLGRLANGARYIATIEPWHGHQVVVYRPPPEGSPDDALWERHVLDEQLKWGHAVWCANLDKDEDEELIIGVRDDLSAEARRGLRIYDPTDGGAAWTKHEIDPGGVAIEDLAAADLDGDGRIDIVAVGRQTNNARIYWNRAQR